MAPPPPRRSTAKVLGITGGVVGALVVVLAGVAVFVDGAEGGFPEAKYRMSVPDELVGGTYRLSQDLSSTAGKQIVEENRSRANVRDPKAVVAQYTGQGDQEGGTLVVSGIYGRYKDPDRARDYLMEGATKGQGATVAVPAHDVTPSGSKVTVSCQVLTSEQGGIRSNVPMCAWGDDNTAAAVGVITPETAVQDPESVDLSAVARTTLLVRKEMREPIG
ncbi:hypothetical protein OG453_44160 [Streptomyces sp. NBC_01381]|uniref:hypothetical protein n=1 Tax=Streptomyces sp. NBC_01381 TaxID=2903845 RepID=UPI00225661D1|nr:hypothetical protein [Streptomyces sp. NBC_01381]MCX4673554.1 hypothetical protein [Streptomyces sp. NBC_01381]